MKGIFSLLAFVALLSPSLADDWSTKAIKSVGMTIEPSEASPGQIVTIKLTVVLNETYHTYPTVQPDRKAKDQVNTIEFAKSDAKGLIYVGTLKEPANPTKKAEPILGIKEMHIFPGTVTYERKAVISPKATAGDLKVQLPKFVLMVCDENNCYPPKTYALEAGLKIKAGSVVEVEKEYRVEVESVLNKK